MLFISMKFSHRFFCFCPYSSGDSRVKVFFYHFLTFTLKMFFSVFHRHLEFICLIKVFAIRRNPNLTVFFLFVIFVDCSGANLAETLHPMLRLLTEYLYQNVDHRDFILFLFCQHLNLFHFRSCHRLIQKIHIFTQ